MFTQRTRRSDSRRPSSPHMPVERLEQRRLLEGYDDWMFEDEWTIDDPTVLAVTDETIETAQNVGVLSGARTFSDSVGSADEVDFYRFELTSATQLDISLDGLSNDADLELQNSNGETITGSYHGGSDADSISRTIEAGTFYARVFHYSGDTGYNLRLSATALQPFNSARVTRDPRSPNSRALNVFGSPESDDIRLIARSGRRVEVRINGTSLGRFSSFARIRVNGYEGDDLITVDRRIQIGAQLYGSSGADSLSGGGGRDLIVGGEGGDSLTGNDADDVMVAGDLANGLTLSSAHINLLRFGVGSARMDQVVSTEDFVGDTLRGSRGADLLVASSDDTVEPLDAVDVVRQG